MPNSLNENYGYEKYTFSNMWSTIRECMSVLKKRKKELGNNNIPTEVR